MEEIINELQERYEKERQKKIEAYKRDQELTEYAQTRWEYHKTMGNTPRAEFYDWVLEMVDRVSEAEYAKEELIEQVKEQDEYIQDNIEPDNTWRDGWFRR